MNGIFFWVPDISGGFPARILAHSLPKQGQNGYRKPNSNSPVYRAGGSKRL